MIDGRIETTPKLPAPPLAVKSAVDELVPKVQALLPGVRNARWIAYRLIEGDYPLRQALISGQFAALVSDEINSLRTALLAEHAAAG